MLEREPSRTAFAAAGHRAAHQVLEEGRVFADPLALPILRVSAEQISENAHARPTSAGMRFFIAARTAFAEDHVRRAVEVRGVAQVVILGAGLDTFAYRSPLAYRLRIFEVDHPATQAWKRRRLQEIGVIPPAGLAFAPVDFERDRLGDGLEAAGFDPSRRSIFVWLGVVPYLTAQAIDETLRTLAAFPGGAEVVFDYGEPAAVLSTELAEAQRERAAVVAALGEPFLSYFDPPVLHAQLKEKSFATIEDLSVRRLVGRFVSAEAAAAMAAAGRSDRGGHVVFAATA